MPKCILAIDQGTTSTRAVLFDQAAKILEHGQQEFQQYFPNDAWVEHDPEEIWEVTLSVCQQVLQSLQMTAADVAAIGITNQRETTIVWDRKTGKAIYPAIVWQDRRTANQCQQLKEAGHEDLISKKTGLLLDPYFSATKISWILNNVEGSRDRAEKGELAFGTIDSFLLWRLTNGKQHRTDVTNAARTLLFNIHDLCWDKELLNVFNIPESMLPEVMDNCANFGETDPQLFGGVIPITGMAGDQHAAAFGQACFHPGMVKSTYGTGSFILVNTGEEVIHSQDRLLTTLMSRIDGRVQYAVEGSIFIAGAAVKWLREKLHIIKESAATEVLAQSLDSNNGVYLVPAFTGLGAPYWEPHARASILGMTRDTGIAEIARATLESVCYQTRDLLQLITNSMPFEFSKIRVDGGMTDNGWFLQFLANMLQVTVEKPKCIETTVMGAAFLAGLQVGFFESLDMIEKLWKSDQCYKPQLPQQQSDDLYRTWQKAVAATLEFCR